MTKPIQYIVEGKWPFPSDMLRRDWANAATYADERLIALLERDFTDDLIDLRILYRVALTIPAKHARFGPAVDRWKSFGWRVISIDGIPTDTAIPYTSVTSPADSSEAEAGVVAAAKAYVTAQEAFKQFERENPHNTGKAWEEAFDARCDAYDALVGSVGKLSR